MTSESGARLLSVVARLNRWASRNAELPLPSAQARLLSLLGQQGSARIGELAEADHCSQPTMTTQVQRLEGAGFVSRVPDAEDGRASVVSLTPAGEALLERIEDAREATLAQVLDGAPVSTEADIDRAVVTIEWILAEAESRQ